MQNYTEISQDEGLLDSLAMILNNDKTALSCSSGAAFPTVNVQIGQLCFRTDENRLYQTKDGTNWIEVADLSKSFTQHVKTLNDAISTQAGVIAANKSSADSAIALRAPIASPTLTGVPKAPTAATGNNSTQIATTAFVSSAVSAAISEIMGGAPSAALDTLYELGKALGDDANFAATMTQALATKVNLSGGTLTGSITAPSFVGALTGNAATATKLQTARTINGVSFDGSANITIADSTKLPLAGGTITGALTVNDLLTTGASGIKTTKIDSTSAVVVLNGGEAQSIHTGGVLASNVYADSAKIPTNGIYSKGKIHTATSVEVGSSVDGVKDTDYVRAIIHPPTHTGGDWEHTVRDDATYAYYKLKYGTSGHLQLRSDGVLSASGGFNGNASTATKLQTTRTIALSGAATGTATPFDGTANITIPITAIDGSKITTGTISAARIPTLNQNTTGSANSLANYGNVTALSGTASPDKGVTLVQGYNNGYPHSYGNSLRLGGLGQGEIYVGWSGTDGGLAPSYIRSKRDTSTATWSEWREILFKDQLSATNVGTATKLATARTINGVSFDGTANITVFDGTKITKGEFGLGLVDGQSPPENLNATTANDKTAWKSGFARYADPKLPGSYGHMIRIGGGTTGSNGGWFNDLAFSTNGGVESRFKTNEETWSDWITHITSKNIGSQVVASAAKLTTARTIGGVSFDGSANINLPGVNTTGNQATTGNAGTATKLATACTINGVAFDGTANITVEDNTKLPTTGGTVTGALTVNGLMTANGGIAGRYVATDNRTLKPNATPQGSFGAYFTSQGGLTGAGNATYGDLLTLNSYHDTSGGNANALFFSKGGKSIFHYQAAQGATSWGAASQLAYVTDNVASATKLATARTINGVSFDGSANITVADNTKLPLSGGTMSGNLNANALGISNTASTGGLGLSLYGGASAGMPNYGLAFSGTPAFGVHGDVGGDWATYFTMSGATNRGWIFKSGNGTGGNVASISATGAFTGNKFALTEIGGANYIANGNGDAASYSSHNMIVRSWWGIGFRDNGDVCRTVLDTRTGNLSTLGTIAAASVVSSGNVTAYSDKRIKEDVTAIENALTKVEKLNGVTFKRKDTLDRQTGLLAQEVEAVLPEAVTRQEASEEIKAITGDEEVLAVNYGALTGLLVESIKELSEKLKAQQELIDKQAKLIENLINKVSHS